MDFPMVMNIKEFFVKLIRMTCWLSVGFFTSANVLAREKVAMVPIHFEEQAITLPINNKQTQNELAQHSVIHEGTYTPLDTVKSVTVLDNSDAYTTKLASLSEEDAKKIDFSNSKVLVIEAGVAPNSGYGVRFNGMIELDDYVVADVSYLTPSNGAACSYMLAISNPYLFVQIKTAKPILVNERLEQRKCETGGLDLLLGN
jgi:hypothetical protein